VMSMRVNSKCANSVRPPLGQLHECSASVALRDYPSRCAHCRDRIQEAAAEPNSGGLDNFLTSRVRFVDVPHADVILMWHCHMT
jgi:hypothetical protein